MAGMSHRGAKAIAVEIVDTSPKKGMIVRLNSEKQFGFVCAGNGDQYFFHFSSVKDTKNKKFKVGANVKFRLGGNKKGLCATYLKVI